jgi:hypothetical protein
MMQKNKRHKKDHGETKMRSRDDGWKVGIITVIPPRIPCTITKSKSESRVVE